ncbi:hypothetical protein GGX14DRAFT_699733 [Mycena pura]|uniref:Uncharacterized protein n=1 Tax=Mycena pura TaxID=153505 RepID=A0AAD6V0W9_9AGAR|nr:hypothetical protein GGX14DRAFT_699733 [Mycena pura]
MVNVPTLFLAVLAAAAAGTSTSALPLFRREPSGFNVDTSCLGFNYLFVRWTAPQTGRVGHHDGTGPDGGGLAPRVFVLGPQARAGDRWPRDGVVEVEWTGYVSRASHIQRIR